MTKKNAKKVLSNFINKIAKERTEFINHPEKGDILATKAEAMVRTMYKMALGYKETIEEDIVKGGKKTGIKEKVIVHPPDKQMINIIYDRLEGKVAPIAEKKDTRTKLTAADKVTEQTTSRINKVRKTV